MKCKNKNQNSFKLDLNETKKGNPKKRQMSKKV